MQQPFKSHSILIAVIVVLALALGIAGFLWVRSSASGVLGAARQTWEQAKSQGRSLTAAACVDTAFARHTRLETASFTALVEERLFLDGCLSTSEPSPDLCTGVPPEGAIVQTVSWALEQCRARGAVDRNCTNLLQPLQQYCGRRKAQTP